MSVQPAYVQPACAPQPFRPSPEAIRAHPAYGQLGEPQIVYMLVRDEEDRQKALRRAERNRRNAQHSTGPRTKEGKAISSQNARKHGLCAAYSHLPAESTDAFGLFVAQYKQAFNPLTAPQLTYFEQIIDLAWQLRRLPETRTQIFKTENRQIDPRKSQRHSADILARRFSEAPNNGFILLQRYQITIQNALTRLIKQYNSLPTTPAIPPTLDLNLLPDPQPAHCSPLDSRLSPPAPAPPPPTLVPPPNTPPVNRTDLQPTSNPQSPPPAPQSPLSPPKSPSPIAKQTQKPSPIYRPPPISNIPIFGPTRYWKKR